LLATLSAESNFTVTAPDLLAYLAAVAAHPAYTERFQADLVQPGLRIPITAEATLFAKAIEIGREVVWLHCSCEGPTLPKDSAIPLDPANTPNEMHYDPAKRRLHVGKGFIDNVPEAV
jgi:predicted helicase